MAIMLKHLSHGLRTGLIVALLTVTSFAAAQQLREGHPDTYVVQRGDTLWDIAGQFLQKPWLWPEIWQANPQIANPHLIYPGDVISLAYLNRVNGAMVPQAVVRPGPREAAPINAIPLDQIEPFLKELSVVQGFEQLPYVVGLEEDQLRSSRGEIAYIRGLPNAQPGDRYAVVRPTVRYTHLPRDGMCCDLLQTQDLDFRGRARVDFGRFWSNAVFPDTGEEVLGYELMQISTGTISRGEVGGIDASTLLLDNEGREVKIGDRLVQVQPQSYDLQFIPHPPAQQLEYGRARIIAVSDALKTAGSRDVVALSVGAREGVDNGTVFSIWRTGSNVVDEVEYGNEVNKDMVFFENKVRLPDEFAGHVMVFRTFDKVSYGLVMDAIRPVRIGYQLKHPDAPY